MRDSWYSLFFQAQSALTPARLRHGVKTALAASLCQALSALLGLEYGYWAAITAIIVMQADLGNSLKASANRVLGTMAGAAAAVALGLLAPPDPAWLEVGLFGLVGVCACLAQVHESFRNAAITAVIALLGWNGQGSLALFSLARTVEILLGVVVAVGVSALVWPARASGMLRVALGRELRGLSRMLAEGAEAFVGRAEPPAVGGMERLQVELGRNRALWQSARREPSLAGRRLDFLPLIRALDRIFEDVRGMRRLVRAPGDRGYRVRIAAEVGRLSGGAVALMEHLALVLEERDPDLPEAGRAVAELELSLAALERRLLELRGQDATKAHPLESIMAAFSFCQALKDVAAHLLGLADDLDLGRA
jgi:uncharacterized membrane protein YccC